MNEKNVLSFICYVKWDVHLKANTPETI